MTGHIEDLVLQDSLLCACEADSSMREGGSDDVVPSSMSKGTVFVTVGTTSFDKLVMAADTSQVKKELCNKGYTHLVIQMGRGSYIPQKVVHPFPLHRIALWCYHWKLGYL